MTAKNVKNIDIKKLRTHAHLSQEQLARLLGTSWVTISRWERQLVEPGEDAGARLGRLSTLLERIGNAIPPEHIFEFLDAPNPVLRGHRPVELLSSDYAFQDLLSFIEGAKSGDMA